MKIYFEIEECKNEELLEKMGQIKSYEEFAELAGEYGWNEAVDAFAALNPWFDVSYCEEWLYNSFFGDGEAVAEPDSILYYAIENRLNKRKEEIEECIINMNKGVRDFLYENWDYIVENEIEEGYNILSLYVNGRAK
jgi:hypothetical protein